MKGAAAAAATPRPSGPYANHARDVRECDTSVEADERRLHWRSWPPALLMALVRDAAAAQPMASAGPIAYTLRFPAPQTHYVEVEATVPGRGRPRSS